MLLLVIKNFFIYLDNDESIRDIFQTYKELEGNNSMQHSAILDLSVTKVAARLKRIFKLSTVKAHHSKLLSRKETLQPVSLLCLIKKVLL